ncbi:hypothetical protein [Parapedobacter sp. DT-150]|uniref:hypothetical protein n=1 Tax=Parapedobacter sp. DT-150 TaxID=3396162 RepID=UPI003F1B3B56
MNKKQATDRIKLTKWQLFWHFSVVPFLLILPVATIIDIIRMYLDDTYRPVPAEEELLWIVVIFIGMALISFFIQRVRLRFKVFDIQYNDEQFDNALKMTCENLEWTILTKRKSYVRASRRWDWSSSWGELITIKRKKDKILINSICDPDAIPSVISYGWNKHNVRTFMGNLKKQSEAVS